MGILTVNEGPRGCGYRKKGGIYLRVDGTGHPCGKLPIELSVCPCCGGGIKPARGWTWIQPTPLLEGRACRFAVMGQPHCTDCPLGDNVPQRTGLLWIGESFYPMPVDWLRESTRMGVSRRIKAVPKGFEVGKTWVLVAHRKAIQTDEENERGEPIYKPGIFHAFQPSRVEYVVKGDETAEEIAALEKRGLSLVNVVPIEPTQIGHQLDMFEGGEHAGS